MSTVIMLASDHCETEVTVRSPLPHVACALAPGEGPHLNQKTQANEDSVAVVPLSDGLAALVADSHRGPGAGERLTRHLVSLLEGAPPQNLDALKETVLTADEKACRLTRDASQSTLLAVTVRGLKVDYVSIADSVLLQVTVDGETRLNHQLRNFAGGTLPLRTLLQHPNSPGEVLWEWGSFTLNPGDTLLLATDGLDPDVSLMTQENVGTLLRREKTAETRAWALVERVQSRLHGGGQDNIGLVVICV